MDLCICCALSKQTKALYSPPKDIKASLYPSFFPQNYRLASAPLSCVVSSFSPRYTDALIDPSNGTSGVVPCQYEDATKRSVPTLHQLPTLVTSVSLSFSFIVVIYLNCR